MTAAVLVAIVAASAWYLAAHAEIFRAIQERYPSWLEGFVYCPSCLGFWAGGAATLMVDVVLDWNYFGLQRWEGVVTAAFVSIWTTPVLGAIQLAAIDKIHKVTTQVGDDLP